MDRNLSAARAAYFADADGSVIWGVSDCATSAAAAIEAATSFDPWFWYRGKYHDRQSLQKLSGVPVGLLVRRIARACNWRSVKQIDGLCLGLMRADEGHAVVMGFEHPKPVWIGRGGVGAVMLHEPKIIRAWKVL
ncbi:MAG: hypothetical protein KI785_15780 [Devosiaceae bacterium]|nr:hypothetical protein [Devosiaceae bacterium MH13]